MRYLIFILLLCCLPAYALQVEETIYVYGDYTYSNMSDTPYYGTLISNPMTIISLREDVNRDNCVDFSDINMVRAAYGARAGDDAWDARCDFDGNGEIDFNDINVVRTAYGETLQWE